MSARFFLLFITCKCKSPKYNRGFSRRAFPKFSQLLNVGRRANFYP